MGGVVDSIENFFTSTLGRISDPLGVIAFSPVNALFGSSSRSGPGTPSALTVRDVHQSTNNTTAPANIVYGTSRVGGVFSFYGLSGANNEYLWYVLAVACHQVQAMSNLIIDGYFIPEASFDGSGNVIAGKFNGLVTRWIHLGTSTQTADTNVTGAFGASTPPYTSSFTGLEVAYIVVRMKRDDTAFSNVPSNIQIDVQGKMVYDPRLDSTVPGGSGAQRNNLPSTWTWSNNGVLCIRDYLTDSLTRGCAQWPASVINDVNVIAQANIADQSIAYTVNSVVQHQNQYTIDGCLTTDSNYADNLTLMLNCINGTLDTINGQFTPVCGQYNAPAYNIDQTWFTAPAKVQLGAKARDLYNCVKGKYYDNQQNYSNLDFYPFVNNTYITADGDQLWRDLDLSLCTDLYRCQRLATLVGRQSRNQRVVQLFLDWRGLQVALGDSFNLTIPNLFMTKVFVATSIEVGLAAGGLTVAITALEDSSGAHTWNSTDAFTVSIPTNPVMTSSTPLTPTSLAALAVADGIKLTWIPPADGIYDHIEVWRSATSAFGSASIIGRVYGDSWLDSNTNGLQYWYWIRAVSLYATYSAYTPSSGGAGATAQAKWVQNGAQMPGTGKQMCPNNGFEINNTNVALNVGVTPTTGHLIDGWTVQADGGNAPGTFTVQIASNNSAAGINCLDITLKNNASIPANTIAQAYAAFEQYLPVIPGTVMSFGGQANYFQSAGAAPAGVTITVGIVLNVYDANKAYLWTYHPTAQLTSGPSGYVWQGGSITLPTTLGGGSPAFVSLVPTVTINNTNASAFVNPGGTTYIDARFDTLYLLYGDPVIAGSGVQLGDSRNVPGATASGVAQGFYISGMALSSPSPTEIDCASGTLLMGGSGSGNVSYNASSVTGLTANTKYYLYYIDPGYAGGSATLHATTVASNLQNTSPWIVYIGFWTTPVSGSGGGGGTGGCLHGSTGLRIRRNNQEIGIFASEIIVGDEVRAEDDTWQPVLQVDHEDCSDWISVGADKVEELEPTLCAVVTFTQPFYKSDGSMVRASELTPGMILKVRGGTAEVCSLNTRRKQSAKKVIIKIPPPHLFYMDAGSFLVHNGNPKP